MKTSYRAAERVVLGGDISTKPGGATQVWVIQLHGNFVCDDCVGLTKAKPPNGMAVALVINARTFRGYDAAFSREPHDLSALGTVIQLDM